MVELLADRRAAGVVEVNLPELRHTVAGVLVLLAAHAIRAEPRDENDGRERQTGLHPSMHGEPPATVRALGNLPHCSTPGVPSQRRGRRFGPLPRDAGSRFPVGR